MNFFSRFFGNNKSSNNIRTLGKLAFLEVDMHNHILPGIDDGSQSISDSIDLIKGLNNLGINKLVCTPHIMDGVHDNTKSTINSAHETLLSAVKEKGLKVDVHAAAEHMIDDKLAQLIEKDNLCIIPGGYVLIEMSYLAESKALFQTILDIQNLGYTPILAHPERYNYYHYNFDLYHQIKNAGCLMQLNLLSISRYYGTEVKSAALTLLKSGMYDFVGTDIHHQKHLNAVNEVISKYPVRDMLKTCNILNASLLDHINVDESKALG